MKRASRSSRKGSGGEFGNRGLGFQGLQLTGQPVALGGDPEELLLELLDGGELAAPGDMGEHGAAGAMTSWGDYIYERDPLGMIRAYKNPTAGLDVRYAYTADDERIMIFDVVANESTWRIRDLDGKVLRELHLDNTTNVWTWKRDGVLREGSPLASVSAAEGVRYIHPDHLGTTRAITDSVGNLVASFDFFPFGELAAQSGLTEEVLQYTGHERDANKSGSTDNLDYMHARYYSPHLSRFLSPDMILGHTSEPQSWNRYVYTSNNPLSFVDPDGRLKIKAQRTRLRNDGGDFVYDVTFETKGTIVTDAGNELIGKALGRFSGAAGALDKFAGGLEKLTERLDGRAVETHGSFTDKWAASSFEKRLKTFLLDEVGLDVIRSTPGGAKRVLKSELPQIPSGVKRLVNRMLADGEITATQAKQLLATYDIERLRAAAEAATADLDPVNGIRLAPSDDKETN